MFFIFTAIASIAMGVVCLRRLDLPITLGAIALTSMLALALQSALALIVGSYNLRIADGALIALQATTVLVYFAGRPRAGSFPRPTLPPGHIYRIASVVTTASLLLTFVCALAPVTSWDAGVAHMALPEAYTRIGRIALLDGNNYSAYPHLMHALFAVALSEDHAPQSATLLVWFTGCLACAAAYGVGSRLHGRGTGVIAASVLSTTPIFTDQASNPSIDLAYTATVLCALYGLFAWHQDRRNVWLVLAALMAGCGCGIRHTAYLSGPFFLAGVLLFAPRSRLRSAVLFTALMATGAAPWLLRTALVTGNPVFPFFSSQVGNSGIPDVDVAAFGTHSSLQGTGVVQLLAFPWSLTMNPAHYGGWSTSPGALWLILGVVGLCVGGSTARAMGAFTGAGLIAIFLFQRFARYAFPFLAPMMIVAALAVERAPKLRKLAIAALLASYALGIGPALALTAMRLPVVAHRESSETYLAQRVERYPAMIWVAQNLPGGAVVLSLDPRAYYFNHPTHTNFEALKSLVPLGGEAQYVWLRARGIRYVFYPEAYVDDSPGFRETGVLDMLTQWRNDSRHFTLIKDFALSNPRTGGMERIEIYEFHAG